MSQKIKLQPHDTSYVYMTGGKNVLSRQIYCYNIGHKSIKYVEEWLTKSS